MGLKDGDTLSLGLSDRVRDKVLKRLQNKFDTSKEIDPDLFAHTWDVLNKAVEKGFGRVKFGEPDYNFTQALKYNNAVFAAFKTHRQQNDLAALLMDEKGNLRSFTDFRKATEPVIGAYNGRWLRTEYDTAVKGARTAALFHQFERDKDLFPNVKWMPSRAIDPREAHKPYYNNVRSLSDPWWKTHYPGSLWGCKCDAKNTAEAITHIGDNPVGAGSDTPDIASTPGIDRNPAFTGSLFTDNHPYVKESYKYAHAAVSQFVIRLDEDKARIKTEAKKAYAWISEHIEERGYTLERVSDKTFDLKVSRGSLKDVTDHFRTATDKSLLPELVEALPDRRYSHSAELGAGKKGDSEKVKKNLEKKAKRGVTGYNYYEIMLGGDTWLLNCEVYKKGFEKPYAVTKKKKDTTKR